MSDKQKQLSGEIMKHALTSAITIVVLGTGWWTSIGRNIVTRDEVLAIVQTQSPYELDKGTIRQSLEYLAESNKRVADEQRILAQAMTVMANQITEVKVELRLQNERAVNHK